MINVRNFTIKDLKDKIKDLPDDMPVLYERIQDEYFNDMGWTTISLRTDIQPTGAGKYEDIHSEFIPVFTGYEIDDYFILTAHY